MGRRTLFTRHALSTACPKRPLGDSPHLREFLLRPRGQREYICIAHRHLRPKAFRHGPGIAHSLVWITPDSDLAYHRLPVRSQALLTSDLDGDCAAAFERAGFAET